MLFIFKAGNSRFPKFVRYQIIQRNTCHPHTSPFWDYDILEEKTYLEVVHVICLFFSYFFAERNKNEGKSWWNHQHEHLQRSSKAIIYNKFSHVFHIVVLFCSEGVPRFYHIWCPHVLEKIAEKGLQKLAIEGNPPTWATKKTLLITLYWLVSRDPY